jgi:hypothetical protein
MQRLGVLSCVVVSVAVVASGCPAGDRALLDSTARISPAVETVVRAKLDSVLGRVIIERLEAAGVRLMAEDSATLAGLEPRMHRASGSSGCGAAADLYADLRLNSSSYEEQPCSA